MEETQVQSLGQEDPLEKGIATHSTFLAWRIPWTEEPGGLPSTGSQRVRQDQATHTFTLPFPAREQNCFFFFEQNCFYLIPEFLQDVPAN